GITVRPRLAQLVPHLPARDPAVLGLDDDPEIGALGGRWIEREHEVAFLGAAGVAGLGARPLEVIVGPTGDLAQHPFEEALEVAALGRRTRPLPGPSACRRLE